MPKREKEQRDVVRGRAKELTTTRQTNYIEGRLGLIIDGTGRDYDRITKQASELQGLGYDTYMIFVNTSLEVALQRNEKRARRVEDSIVKSSWNSVQQNIGKFSLFFKNGFIVVDNNRADEDVMRVVSKRVRSLLKKPVQNGRAKAWIQNELRKRKR
jgi:predicted kinase